MYNNIMNHKIHEMNTCYATQPIWALFAVSNGDKSKLVFSRGFCMTS